MQVFADRASIVKILFKRSSRRQIIKSNLKY